MNPNSALRSLFSNLRNLNAWLLVTVLAIAWPHAQEWLEKVTDRQTAVWLPAGNPASKITVTLFVVALGIGFTWVGQWLNHTTNARWAKKSFKTTFLSLPAECKLKYFTVYWFGSLFFFALVWVGACLLQ